MPNSRDPHHTSDAEAARMVKKRKYVHVPRDQAEILRRSDDKWHADMKDQPGFIASSVPPQVLEGAKALYLHNHPPPGSVSQPASSIANGVAGGDALQSRQTSPERQVSWSPSPPRDGRPQRQLAEFATQVAEEPPPSSSPQHERAPPARRNLDLDSSQSDGTVDEMEVDVPQAVTVNDHPGETSRNSHQLSKTSTPQLPSSKPSNGTPTCAQPHPAIIPCTQATQKPGWRTTPQKPHRRMKPIEFSDGVNSPSAVSPSQIQTGLDPRRMPHLRVASLPQETQSSASTGSSAMTTAITDERKLANGTITKYDTKSVQQSLAHEEVTGREDLTEATARETVQNKEYRNDQNSSNGVLSQQGRANSTGVVHRREGQPTQNEETWRDDDLPQAEHDQRMPAEPHEAHGKGTQSEATKSPSAFPVAPPLPLRSGHDPFDHFCDAYPQYRSQHRGSFILFIRACVLLESLRADKELKPILYDDFVRFFSHTYTTFATQKAGLGETAQPALECYNDEDEDLVFRRRVLGKETLDLVRTAYPDDFAEQARRISSRAGRQSAVQGQRRSEVETTERGSDVIFQTQIDEPQYETVNGQTHPTSAEDGKKPQPVVNRPHGSSGQTQSASSNMMPPPRAPTRPGNLEKTRVQARSTSPSTSSKAPLPRRSSVSLRKLSHAIAAKPPRSEISLASAPSSPPRASAARKYFNFVPASTPAATPSSRKRNRSCGTDYFRHLQSQVEADPEERARAARIAERAKKRRSGMSVSSGHLTTSREGSLP